MSDQTTTKAPSAKAIESAMLSKPYSITNKECTPFIHTLAAALEAKGLYKEISPKRSGKSQQSWLSFLQKAYDDGVQSKEVAGTKKAAAKKAVAKKAPAKKATAKKSKTAKQTKPRPSKKAAAAPQAAPAAAENAVAGV